MSDRPPQNSSAPESIQHLSRLVMRADRRAFEALHARLRGGLLELMRRRAGPRRGVAEELGQETWAEAWRMIELGRYDAERAAFSTFLYAIARNLWLRHRRERGRHGPHEAEFDELKSPLSAADPRSAVELAEMLDALRACIASAALNDEERAVVSLVMSGETERSIASLLGVAASTVNLRKACALTKLQRCMRRKGFSRSAFEQGPRRGE